MAAKRRCEVWEKLEKNMTAKRGKNGASNRKTAPREITVQRLSAEPDNRQTYKPVHTREFVEFDFEDVTLENIKTACSQHFCVPVNACDVLVSNKGPSCTNIAQIPHRKDKVYLVRFIASVGPVESTRRDHEEDHGKFPSTSAASVMPSSYPESVSIDQLLGAGKFIKPSPSTKVVLEVEAFNLFKKEWNIVKSLNLTIEKDKFASGAFRDAYKCREGGSGVKWVLKMYNDRAKSSINNVIHSTVEVHTRKSVQMHTVAREITKKFTSRIPDSFGESFVYNKVYYSTFNDQPVTVEEYVPGIFTKYVNNDGKCSKPQDNSDTSFNVILEKAQSLVHFSYSVTEQKLMLLDIQGSRYTLYDPEIATTELLLW